jgi:type I restriction enzyme S subunit
MGLRPGYRRTDVGVIPDDWYVKPLADLGKFKNGINKGKEDFGHGFPFINLMDVFGIPRASAATTDLGLVNSTAAERKLYELKGGDVLFVRSSVKPTGVGLTTLIPEDLPETVFSGFLIRYRDAGLLEHHFKEHCFWDEGFRGRLVSNSTVSANTNINQEALKRLQIAVPPSASEQRAIAAALSDVDALLAGLHRLIAKKRDLKQAAMQQLLTGQTRLPGFTDEWELTQFGDLVEIRKGQLITQRSIAPGPVPVVAGGKQPAYFHSTANREGKTITVSASGASAGYVNFYSMPIFASDCSTIGESSEYCIEFIYFLLQSQQERIYRAQTGGAQPHIHPADLAPLEFAMPKHDEQSAIAAVLSEMDAELAALERRRVKTSDLKQAMMQELLTGRIRLVTPEAAHA